MKNIIIIIILFIFSNNLFATIQTPDLLIIENDTLELREMKLFPLEFLNFKYRPFGYTRKTAPNTACWRRYQAIWRIIKDEVYLDKIQRCYDDKEKGNLENLSSFFIKNEISFQEKNNMILASWLNLELYELTSLFSHMKNRKAMLSDNWLGKKSQKNPNYVLIIKNGKIELNRLKKNDSSKSIIKA